MAKVSKGTKGECQYCNGKGRTNDNNYRPTAITSMACNMEQCFECFDYVIDEPFIVDVLHRNIFSHIRQHPNNNKVAATGDKQITKHINTKRFQQ